MKKESNPDTDQRRPSAPPGPPRQRTFVSKKNRGRVVYVPISFVSLLFGGGLLSDDAGQYILVPVIEGIPVDASLVMVMACPERDAVGLKYLHRSFDEVPEGFQFPDIVPSEITH